MADKETMNSIMSGISQQLRPQKPQAPRPTGKPQQAQLISTAYNAGNKTQLRPSGPRPRPVPRPSRPGGPAVPPAPLKKMPRGMA